MKRNKKDKTGGQAKAKGLVLWYSQTGYTERYAKLIAHAWEEKGLAVDVCSISQVDTSTIGTYDIIAFGTPVYYWDVPLNVKDWLKALPRIDTKPVAAFVSYGGKGENQHNTAVSVLELLKAKGGIPVGMTTFGNLGTFPPFWIMESWAKNGLEFSHLPNEATYAQVRAFAQMILERAQRMEPITPKREFSVREIAKGKLATLPFKLLTKKHVIDKARCTACWLCQKKCPVDAIDVAGGCIDTKSCILCYGCINTCPAQAMQMEMLGRKITGFCDLMERNRISITRPEELRNG